MTETAHVVLLVLVVLHQRDDAVVDEEGQSEDPGQLREEHPELWSRRTHKSASGPQLCF